MVQTAKQLITANPDRLKIAIIEDDVSIHDLIMGSIQMEFENVEGLKFSNSQDAIHELWQNHLTNAPHLDVLFLDIFLDNQTSGFDVLEYCQFIPQNIPVILMSSQFTSHQLEKVSKMKSPPILLRKPFKPTELLQLIKWVFDLNTRR